MIGKSAAMKEIFKLVERVAPYNTTVLIAGESGTGKELIAKGIHLAGERSGTDLVSIDCGGIPDNLLESEFFGYKKGAFTGADKDKKGLFQEADQGTIFLDEIGELPVALQVKLLRVLQENEIRPIGDTRATKVDVRVIAATKKNLENEVAAGNFREDLYYRLNVLNIQIPPLRDRIEDVPLLIDLFIDRYNKRLGKEIKAASTSAIAQLMKYTWPGNIRELANAIHRAVLMCRGSLISIESREPATVAAPIDFESASRKFQKEFLEKAIITAGGNKELAARTVGLSRSTFYRYLMQFKI